MMILRESVLGLELVRLDFCGHFGGIYEAES
jgi:hypothetical protein